MLPPAADTRAAGRRRRTTLNQIGLALLALVLVMLGAGLAWRVEIERALLDPGVPYQIYRPPPAPDYAKPSAWALLPDGRPSGPGADIFFVHGTTYDGGRDWNAPIGEAGAERLLARVQIPNYAGPFQALGRVFAPRYRQASLYSFSTLRDDAREARRFPLGDVEAALAVFIARAGDGRALILVGEGQGGELLGRAATDALANDPTLRARIAAVYLIHVAIPADEHGPGAPLPACARRDEAHCLIAWRQAPEGGERAAATLLGRALAWSPEGQLVNLGSRSALCVNPLTGAASGGPADERANLGAANASGLEWGVRPAFLPRQVSAECRGGLLDISRPHADSFKPQTGWLEPLRAPPFNLFYADLEADARARLAAMPGRGRPAPPITQVESVRASPIHRIR